MYDMEIFLEWPLTFLLVYFFYYLGKEWVFFHWKYMMNLLPLANNTGAGHERLLSWHPFMEIRNYDIMYFSQAKTSIPYSMQLLCIVHETLALLKSMAKIVVFNWSRISLLFLLHLWIFNVSLQISQQVVKGYKGIYNSI